MKSTEMRNALTPEPFVLQRRIGSTTYRVKVHFNPKAKETMDDKVMRLLRNDLNHTLGHVKMKLPQTGRLSERGSA